MGIAKKKQFNAPTLFKFTSFCTKIFLSWDTDRSSLPGGLPYERGGDARRFVAGVNFGFWSHLGCSGQNAKIFSRKGLLGL